MSNFFKKIFCFALFLMLSFLLSDSLFAQYKQRTRSNTTPNINNSINSGNCCKKNGKCIDKNTGASCGTSSCPPCTETSTSINSSNWGTVGAVNPCDNPFSANCKNSLLFNAPTVKGRMPFFVDKKGQTFVDKAVITGDMMPAKANVSNLGSSKKPFKAVFAQRLIGQVSKYSDRRLKTNFEALPYGLQTVMELKPSMYHYKNNLSGGKELGLIAQDLQETVPEVVNQSGEYLSVDYAALVPVLIQAIQDQQQIIESQKATIEGQETAMEQTQMELKDLKANLAEVMDYLQLKEVKTTDAND